MASSPHPLRSLLPRLRAGWRRLVGALVLALTAITTLVIVPVALAPSAAAAGSPTCPTPAAVVNGGFEQPVIPAKSYTQTNQTNVPGWKTTATDGLIEIWSTGYLNVPSAGGNQFAEINATQAAALYQVIPTVPGEVIAWSLKHRARQGTDVMRLQAGPDGGTLTTLGTMSDTTARWNTYTGTYTVPAGQTSTRFSYEAVSTGSGSISVGNFLDDVSLRSNACVSGSKTVSPTGTVIAGNTLTYSVQIANQGGGPTTAATVSDVIPTGTAYVANSITVNTGSGAVAVSDATGYNATTKTVTVSPAGGVLAAGASATVSFKVTVQTSARGTSVTNIAHVTSKDEYGTSAAFDTNTTSTPVAALPTVGTDTLTAPYQTAISGVAPGLLANDTGATIHVSSNTNPSHGTVVVNASGAYTYTPAAGYHGADSFTYTITDAYGQTATGTVNITVTAGAVASADSATVYAGSSTNVNVLANDTVDPSYTKSVSAVGIPAHGTASINADGTITYTPTAGYTGTDSFTYTLSDGHGSTATATVTMTVYAAAKAVNDSATVYTGNTVNVPVLTNDTVDAAFTKSVSAVGTPSHGTATINADGTIHYVPTAGYTGTDSFTYTLSDGHGSTSTATVSVTVYAKPAAANDTGTVYTGGTTNVNVLANDSVDPAFTKSVTSVTTPTHGTATVNADGTIKYTPTAGYTGTDTFTYTLSDGHGSTATATVTMTVYATAKAVNDTGSVYTGATVNVPVLTNDSVDPAFAKSVSAVGSAAHGTATANPDGTIAYTPTAGYTGTDTFTYTLSDGHGSTSTATVTMTVYAAAKAVNDSASLYSGSSTDVNVLGNDTVDPSYTKSVTAVGTPAHGAATINPDGTIHYVPNAGYTGTDSFTYTLSDGHGSTSSATVAMAVYANANAADDSASLSSGSSTDVNVLGNDSVDPAFTKSVSAVGSAAHGTTAVNPDGTIAYTPTAGYTGTDSFTYTLSDGHGSTSSATVTMTVYAKPAAADDSGSVYTGGYVIMNVLGNDTVDPASTKSVSAVGSPAHGTAVVNPDSTITYTPTAGYTGTDSFTYTLSDGHGSTATATVTMTVYAQANAVNDSATTYTGNAVVVPVLANDTVDGAFAKSVSSASTPAYGTAAINPDGTVTYTPNAGSTGTDSFTYTLSDGHGSTSTATVSLTIFAPAVASPDSATVYAGSSVDIGVLGNDSVDPAFTKSVGAVGSAAHGTTTINPDGTVTYTPNAGSTGTDSFTYTLSDGHGSTSTTTVSITVYATASAVDDSTSLYGGDSVTVPVLANDSVDPAFGKAVSAVGSAAHGTATANPDGTVTYTPNAGYTGTDSFTYTLSDGHGSTSTATVSVTVYAKALATDDSATLYRGDSVAVNVLGNDSVDPAFAKSVSAVGSPSHGTATANPDGTITYTPTAGYTGTDSFTYTLSDGHGSTSVATVSMTVYATPSAVADSVTLDQGGSATVNVLGNDSVDPAFTKSVSAVGTPAHGTATINADGTITYTPAPSFTGIDSFTYTLSDGNGRTATGTVNCTVRPPAPTATDDSATTSYGATLNVPAPGVLGNDTGAGLAAAVATQPPTTAGTVVMAPDGSYSFVPTVGFTGKTSFTYTATDSFGRTATATVTITVSFPTKPTCAGWTTNGLASYTGPCQIQLNPTLAQYGAGTSFWPNALPLAKVATISFDMTMGGGLGDGADGIGLVFADPGLGATPSSLGGTGGQMGIGGINATVVKFDTFQNTGDLSNNFVGLCSSPAGVPNDPASKVGCRTSVQAPMALRGATPVTHHVVVTLANYFTQPAVSTVTIDGTPVVTGPNLNIPKSGLIGFSAGTGLWTDLHVVSNIALTYRP